MTAELVLERSGGDGYACFRIPCLVRTDAGTILACYECRKSRDDWAEIDLGLRRSTDGGKSFSARKILVRGEGKTLNNPVLFADRSRIVLLWQQEYHRTFCCVSTDEGQRFSAPRELTAFTDDGACTVLACGPGHGTVLPGGRYLVPMWRVRNPEDPKAHRPSVLTVFYSDDRGETWHLGREFPDAMKNPSEAAAAAFPGGMLMSIRTEDASRCRTLSVSRDNGVTWSPVRRADALPDPVCQGSLVSDGRTLYLCNCADRQFRRNLTVRASADGGETWSDGRCIDPVGGYSDLALSADGQTLFVLSEQTADGIGITGLVFRRIPTASL